MWSKFPKKNILVAHAGEGRDLGDAGNNTPDGPVHCNGDVSHGGGESRDVDRDVHGWEILELDRAAGDLQDRRDEVVQGVGLTKASVDLTAP